MRFRPRLVTRSSPMSSRASSSSGVATITGARGGACSLGQQAGFISPRTGTGTLTPLWSWARDTPGGKIVKKIERTTILSIVDRSKVGSDPCPQETNVLYPDQDLESLNSSSIDTCVDTCTQNSVCVGVTFEGNMCILKHSTRSRWNFTKITCSKS